MSGNIMNVHVSTEQAYEQLFVTLGTRPMIWFDTGKCMDIITSILMVSLL